MVFGENKLELGEDYEFGLSFTKPVTMTDLKEIINFMGAVTADTANSVAVFVSSVVSRKTSRPIPNKTNCISMLITRVC